MNILLTDINENRRTDIPSSFRAFRHLPFFIRRWAFGVGRSMFVYSESVVCRPSSVVRPQPSSSGIALVMVLGILSVMVIMAVAFAISMRTERVAAGNYADSVRARQLVQAGLVRALSDLANQLGAKGLGSAAGGTNYPHWSVTNSYTTEYTNTSANKLYLLTGEATNFVPRALWVAAMNADRHVNATNHWLPLDIVSSYTTKVTTNAASIVETNTEPCFIHMGRVKYLILNCSGLLDANFVGGQARSNGVSPREIAINQLGDLPASFTNDRDKVGGEVRYETLEELAALHNVTTNFCVYSRALPGYWDAASQSVRTQVNLAGDEAKLSGRSGLIKSAFQNAGFTNSGEANILFDNLLDYVDLDSTPKSDISVEPVPMINEMMFSNNVVYNAGPPISWDTTGYVTFELWYPFASGSGTYSFAANVTFDSTVVGAGSFTVSGSNNFAFSALSPFKLAKFNNSTPYPYNQDPKDFNISIGKAFVGSNSPYLDQLKPSVNLLQVPQNQAKAMECLDPRFNYDPASSAWQGEGGNPALWTFGKTNKWTSDYLSSTNASDGDTEMYVANGQLHSVAELGCLVYSDSQPWKTVKLYGTNLHRVLDVFGLDTNSPGSDYVVITNYGLVNCNPNVAIDATAAVFAGMPVDQYPGGAVVHSADMMTEARAVATNIFYGGMATFTNLSDVGRNMSYFPGANTELERESYFRNAFNLFNLRQNLFTIIIEADVASGGNIPSNPVRQRAVAIVWRDPYTGEMFVRSIKWLKD